MPSPSGPLVSSSDISVETSEGPAQPSLPCSQLEFCFTNIKLRQTGLFVPIPIASSFLSLSPGPSTPSVLEPSESDCPSPLSDCSDDSGSLPPISVVSSVVLANATSIQEDVDPSVEMLACSNLNISVPPALPSLVELPDSHTPEILHFSLLSDPPHSGDVRIGDRSVAWSLWKAYQLPDDPLGNLEVALFEDARGANEAHHVTDAHSKSRCY
jgi:hypothetical protein